jgi:hypothetical protein
VFNGGGAVLTVSAVRGAGDAGVAMVSDAAGQRAWRCPGHVAAPAAFLAFASWQVPRRAQADIVLGL